MGDVRVSFWNVLFPAVLSLGCAGACCAQPATASAMRRTSPSVAKGRGSRRGMGMRFTPRGTPWASWSSARRAWTTARGDLLARFLLREQLLRALQVLG